MSPFEDKLKNREYQKVWKASKRAEEKQNEPAGTDMPRDSGILLAMGSDLLLAEEYQSIQHDSISGLYNGYSNIARCFTTSMSVASMAGLVLSELRQRLPIPAHTLQSVNFPAENGRVAYLRPFPSATGIPAKPTKAFQRVIREHAGSALVIAGER